MYHLATFPRILPKDILHKKGTEIRRTGIQEGIVSKEIYKYVSEYKQALKATVSGV